MSHPGPRHALDIRYLCLLCLKNGQASFLSEGVVGEVEARALQRCVGTWSPYDISRYDKLPMYVCSILYRGLHSIIPLEVALHSVGGSLTSLYRHGRATFCVANDGIDALDL